VLKKIDLKDAVGTKLAHDITEIRPGEFKGAAFLKGHTVCDDDLCHLQKLGKNHLYQIDLAEDEIHEDEAAAILAAGLAGDGIVWQDAPREGKIKLLAERDGLFTVNTTSLAAFNMVDEVMCATLHNHTLVKKGDLVAATRAIPLIMQRAPIDRAAAIAQQNGATLSVKTLRKAKAGLVITGNEVYHGLIEDRFAPILSEKVTALGSTVEALAFAPDDPEIISSAIRTQLEHSCDLLMLSGGMSVDPDDETRRGIRLAGAGEMYYGSAVLPCGLYHRITVLDLVLPRILAGEKIGKAELALLGHGGLCKDCEQCVYPHCPFGKGA
jgi:hypothetical protein